MSWSLLLGLAAVGCALAAWRDGMRAREAAAGVARAACRRHGVQLLDDTVELVSVRLGAARGRRWPLRRIYRFEFTPDGSNRYAGSIALSGGAVDTVHMPGPDGELLH